MKLIDTPLLYSSIVSLTCSAITAGSSSMANVTVRSNPCGPCERAGLAIERIGGEPRFMRARRAPAARDHGRLDPLAAGAGAALDREDRPIGKAGLQRRPPDAGHQHLQIRLGHRVALPGFPRREVLVVRRRVGARQFNWPSALPNRQHLAVAILLRIIAFCVPPSAGRSGLSFPVFLAGFRHAD